MKLHFKGRLLKIITQKRRLPNGYLASLEIVEHPGAVLIVPFWDSDRLVILRQFRPVVGCTLYEFPAGTLKPDEPPLVCARRELLEETGYTARKLIKLGKIFPVPGYSTEIITILKAEGLRVFRKTSFQGENHPRDSEQKDPDEILKACILSRAQIRRLFRGGRLQDAKTICALGFCGII